MKLYPKIAIDSMVKNKKLYLPYLLTCIIMVMMFVIVSAICSSRDLEYVEGGGVLARMMLIGMIVIGIFSIIFLIYTNSFLMKRRRTEFGLYNILGMSKGNIAKVLLFETIIIYIISMILGTISGVLFAKLGEMISVKLLDGDVQISFHLPVTAIVITAVLFAAIFFIIYIKSLIQISRLKPIELLKSVSQGERRLKVKWVSAVLGILFLGAGYYIALTTDDPVKAMYMFFIAVACVIIGTYLVFIAGSGALLDMLKRNKRYYYKKNHFVAVSSLRFRMNRNGAGLASICIIATMILVMISSTATAYIGSTSVFEKQYPRQFIISAFDYEKVMPIVNKCLDEEGIVQKNTLDYAMFDIMAEKDGDKLTYSRDNIVRNNSCNISVVCLDYYNTVENKHETLEDNEVIIQTLNMNGKFNYDKIYLENTQLNIKRVENRIGTNGFLIDREYFTIVVNDMDSVYRLYDVVKGFYSSSTIDVDRVNRFHCFDVDANRKEQQSIRSKILKDIDEYEKYNDIQGLYLIDSSADAYAEFLAVYGGIFMLGILLSFVFMIASVLIIYYKQITEGYEDENRFEILQNVGMTNKEIRKTINSQMLTMFFLPLIVAGIHIAFAFRIISKLLILFSIQDTMFQLTVTLICFAVFAVLYTLVYSITSRAYYRIVVKK